MTTHVATRLCLVRHGETAWNAEHRVQGQLDIPLSDIGLRQARAVGAALQGERFDAIYSSDLVRARQTGDPIAIFLSIEMILEKELRERHYGIFERLTYAEVKVRYPQDFARFDARDPQYAFRTGESLQDFYDRSISVLSKIANRNENKNILVFTHGGVLDQLYRFITGRPISAQRDFGIPNAGLNRLEVTAEGWQIRTWAETGHLERTLDDLPE